MLNKIIFLFIITIFININIFPEEDLSKFYLTKSYEYYKENKKELALQLLNKSYEYSKKLPEYYYISNLLLEGNRKYLNIKRINAKMILDNIGNAYLINEYELLKNAVKIFGEVKDYEIYISANNKLFTYKSMVVIEDYLDFINIIIYSGIDEYISLIPSVIIEAKKLFNSIDLDYFWLLYKVKVNIKNKDFDINEFNKNIRLFYANNYPIIKIIYLKALFFNDAKNINDSYKEYKSIPNNQIENEVMFKKRILFEFLKKVDYFSNKIIPDLLNEWAEIGNNDYKTEILLKNKKIYDFINKDKNLKKMLIEYTGIREKDDNEDGEWEELYKYEKGIVIEKIVDKNQDNVYEELYIFFNKGNINEYISYLNGDKEYKKYIFNENDMTLQYIDYYKDKIREYRETFDKSLIKYEEGKLNNILNKENQKYVTLREEWTPVHKRIKLYKNQVIYEEFDIDNNDVFEEKAFYKDGVKNEVLKDLNGNNIYEIYEGYENNKLKFIKYKTDESLKEYNYIEYLTNNNKILKYWDNDYDGIFEILIEDYNNGVYLTKFDINFDKKYDYAYEYKNGQPNALYRLKDDSMILLKKYKQTEKEKKLKWRIISVNDIDKLLIPDDIYLKDKNKLSGTFIYKGKKDIFKNGKVENEFFRYKLFIIGNEIFLLDIDSL